MTPEEEEFIRGFVHDIRNPISVIVGYADILKHKNDRISDEKRKLIVDSLYQTVERLSRIVDEFSAERKRRQPDA